MAKPGEGNFLLLHVEKLVVVVALAVLAATIYLYPMSPPQVALQKNGPNSTDIAPDKVDDYLVGRFAALNDGKAPKRLPDEMDFLADLNARQNPGFDEYKLVDLTAPQPFPKFEVGDFDRTVKLVAADLEKLIPPASQPAAAIFSELRNTDKRTQKVVAHATALFPADTLQRLWREAMKKSILPPNLLVVDAVWERQEMQSDGTWGQAQPIAGVCRLEKDNEGKDVLAPPFPDFNGQNGREVQDFISNYRNNGWDSYKVQPDYWEVLRNSQWVSWKAHLVWTEAADQANAAGGGNVPVRGQPVRTPVRPPVGSPGGDMPGMPGGGMPGMPGGGMPGMPGAGMPGMPGGYPGGVVAPGGRTRPGTRQPTVPQPVAVGAAEPVTVTPVPSWSWQMLNKVQVWMHDDTVTYQKRYRYHVKLVLLNPLFGHPNESKSPEDARLKFIESRWSEWSEPVKSPPQARFFLTGASQMLGTVRFAVFTQLMGQTVMQEYNVKLGEKIGGLADKTVADPDAPGKTITAKCDFFTGGTVLSIDWEVPILQRGMTVKTSEVVVADEDGNIWIRNKVFDAGCIELSRLMELTRKVVAIEKAKPAQPQPRRGTRRNPVVLPPGPMGPGAGGPGGPPVMPH